MIRILSKNIESKHISWKKGIKRTQIFEAHNVIFESSATSFANAELYDKDLPAADLDNADLRNVDFSGSVLLSASFRFAQLDNCNFKRCILNGCDFTSSILGNADFSNASLEWANFSNCDMSSACFDGALMFFIYYNSNTIWPDNLNPDEVKAKICKDE